MFTFDRISIRYDSFLHLVLGSFDSVRRDLLLQKGPDHLLDLLEMVRAHLFYQGLVLCLRLDGVERHLLAVLIAWQD